MPDEQSLSFDKGQQLYAMIHGYRLTCLVATAVELGFPDALRDGAFTTAELARRLALDHDALLRFIRALVAIGIVHLQQDVISLTDTGRLLLGDDSPLRDRAILAKEEYMLAWMHLGHSLRTGKPAFDDVFGMTVWRHRQEHPALSDAFHRVMVADQHTTCRAIVNTIGFEEY